MNFGIRVPDWKIRGDLSYARCEELTSKGDFNICTRSNRRSEYWLTRNTYAIHPLTNVHETAYSFRMYRTHVLTWFKDGTVAYSNWDSAGTREVQRRWGPIAHIWKDSRSKFAEKARFTTPNGNYVDGSFPFNDPVVDCNGYVHGLVDTYKVIDPARRKERIEIGKEFRSKAFSRMLLGEFGDVWAKHVDRHRLPFTSWGERYYDGWVAMVPYGREKQHFAEVLLGGGVPELPYLVEGPIAKDPQDAVRKACEVILREGLLSGSQWYVEKKVEYEPVKVTA